MYEFHFPKWIFVTATCFHHWQVHWCTETLLPFHMSAFPPAYRLVRATSAPEHLCAVWSSADTSKPAPVYNCAPPPQPCVGVPLSCGFQASCQALGSVVCCLLALYSSSSSSSRTSSMGLVFSQFYIEIKGDSFAFYTFQCSIMCVQLCFLFRGICSQATTPMNSGKCPPQPLSRVVNDFPEGVC